MEVLGCGRSEDLRTDRPGLVTNRNHSNRRVTKWLKPGASASITKKAYLLTRRGFSPYRSGQDQCRQISSSTRPFPCRLLKLTPMGGRQRAAPEDRKSFIPQ